MKFLTTILFALGLCSSASTSALDYNYLSPRFDHSLSIRSAFAAGLQDAQALQTRSLFDDILDDTNLHTRSLSDETTLAIRSAEASAEAWRDLATTLATQLILERRGGSRPGTPTGTPAYTRMAAIKSDMVPGHRYVFRAVQPPKDTNTFGDDMIKYCARKGYNHQFLIVGEVTAAKDFVAKWWDLRKDDAKSTSSASEKFDASRGTSLTISYLGTTTKNDASISANGREVNKAAGSKWVGDAYDCKSYVDQLAVKIVGH